MLNLQKIHKDVRLLSQETTSIAARTTRIMYDNGVFALFSSDVRQESLLSEILSLNPT